MPEDSADKPTHKRRRRRRSPQSSEHSAKKPDEPKQAESEESEESEESVGIPIDDCAFAEFNLKPELVRGLARAGYHTPSPIQARSLPYAL
jgi:superfamily II DNA/RNA helicase